MCKYSMQRAILSTQGIKRTPSCAEVKPGSSSGAVLASLPCELNCFQGSSWYVTCSQSNVNFNMHLRPAISCYHNNSPDMSPLVNLTSARSANSNRLFSAVFSDADTVEPMLQMFMTPPVCRGSAPAFLGQPGSPCQLAVPCLFFFWLR